MHDHVINDLCVDMGFEGYVIEANISKTEEEYMFIAYSFPFSKPSLIKVLVGSWTDHEEYKGRRWGGPSEQYGPHFALSSDLTYCIYITTECNSSLHVHHSPHTPVAKGIHSTELKPTYEILQR